jgi:hypothetical protein
MIEAGGEARASKRSAADTYNPLHHRGILQLVLDFVGQAEHAFVSTISKSFRACYTFLSSKIIIKMTTAT